MAQTVDERLTQRNIALGELINDSTDPEVKKIIGAYRFEEKYQKNLSVITHSIFTSAMLEKACEYLGITTRFPNGNKVYKNKKLMGDRIILKIEACFPTCCDECSADYKNNKDDTPLFTCFICWQGSHNCQALQNQKRCLDELDSKPVGQAWLCQDCRKRNQLIPSNASHTGSEREEIVSEETEVTEPHVTEEPDETLEPDPAQTDQEENENRQSPRRNMSTGTSGEAVTSVGQNARIGPICEKYKKHQCPHGVSGKKEVEGRTCPHLHPRLCRVYLKNGTNIRGGCKKGNACKFFHPKLCRSSVRAKTCTNLDCTFTHLKGTRRKTEENPTRSGILKGDQFRLPIRNRSDSNSSNVSWKERNENTPMHKHFQKTEKNKKTSQEDISFLVTMIEDLKGTQKELQQNVISLQQLMIPSVNQGQLHLLPRPSSQQGPIPNPAQRQLPAHAPWYPWANQTLAPPSFC